MADQSFGRYLQSHRLAQKISLEKIAEETRIAAGSLRWIEQEEMDRLPDEVFVKGFLRAYAKAVGADGDEAVRRFEDKLELVRRIRTTDHGAPEPAVGMGWRLFAALALLALLITGSVLVVRQLQTTPGTDLSERPPDSTESPGTEPVEAGRQNPASGGDRPEATGAGQLTLRIIATEEVQIKAIADHGQVVQHHLQSGQELELKAANTFNLLIGNAAGVKMTMNGRPVKIPGNPGEAVNLILP
jgi:cytoskeletal protein RodZ